MKKPILPLNESERIKALESYSILDSLPEEEYDSITQLASYICGTPIALITLLDENRQWFKSSVGGIEASETSRDISFCQYTIMGEDVYEVNNAEENEIFANNPLVTGSPDIRFYAGAPLHDANGFNLGSLCVIDTKPRILSKEQKNALKLLASQVVLLLDLRKKNVDLNTTQLEFHNFIELSRDLVCIANVDATFHKVTPAFTAVLGYTKEELEGRPFVNYIHPEDLDKTYKEIEKLALGHKTISFENRYLCKNGAYVLLSWNTSPDPKTGNLYCIARDITFDRKKQEIVVQTKNELKAILNSSEFSIIATDLDGTVKQFNRGAENLLGYQADEVVGKESITLFHMVNEVVQRSQELSEELGEFIEPGFEVFFAKALKFGIADTQDWTYLSKDGSAFPVQLSVTDIRNSLGEITGYLGIAKDVSKEKEAEHNLLNSNILLDESQRIAKIGSWKYDIGTNNLVWSEGHYTIFELPQLPENELNDAYRSRIHPEDLIILDELSDNVVKTGENFKINYRIVLPDGRIKQIVEIGQPYKNRRREVVGMQGTIQDVTDEKTAEQNLIDANKLLDESQTIAKIGSWKYDLVTNDLYWSKGHYQIFELEELPPNQLNAISKSRIHPDDLSVLEESDKIMMETGNDFKISYRVLFPDNRVKQILEIGQPYRNKKGEIIGMQGTIQDITKEREAELNLINSNKLLDESQSIAKIGSWKLDLITNDLTWSKGHYQIFGLEELPSDQLFSAYRDRIHPDDLAALDDIIAHTLKTGDNLHYNHRFVLPDGSFKYLIGIGKAYKNEEGEVVSIQGTIQDITEKTLAEQIIIENAKEINDVRSALDESSIVTITDHQGIITFVNDKFCSISKYPKEELLGYYHYLDNPHYKLNRFIKNIWTTIGNGRIWKGEIMNVAKDGSWYWVHSTIVPFLNSEGKPYQYIAISSDITEQKQAQKNLNNALTDLEKKNKELDQFAYVVSHDLKAPLRAINNLSEWIMEDMPEMPADVSANFGLLRGRVMRMENLINGVLDYSRIGKTSIEGQMTDLKKMLHQIVETVVPTEGYEVYIADTIPEIKIARILFEQIFANLISNAVKYNDKPIGKIECQYESLPNFYQFTIKDNGPGIAEKYHEKVFKVFQTIEARDKKESTGVGLSIVQKIIEEMGGTIRIESEEDKGASFIFTIPKK
ncbi:PAS domain S-box protein [Flavobacterium sp. Arc3]|uniref:PAS domain S-box protein n=1 Tax=Flavobacterium sp. Arc3 TaxID=3046686 RepID=UPI00352F4263